MDLSHQNRDCDLSVNKQHLVWAKFSADYTCVWVFFSRHLWFFMDAERNLGKLELQRLVLVWQM